MGTPTSPAAQVVAEIARRIEHGQRRVLKALSRSPIAIRQILTIGEDLKSGRRSIQEIVTFEEEELTEEKLRKRRDDIVRRIRERVGIRQAPPADQLHRSGG